MEIFFYYRFRPPSVNYGEIADLRKRKENIYLRDKLYVNFEWTLRRQKWTLYIM